MTDARLDPPSRAQWPEPVTRVARVLRDGRVEARIEEFAEGTPSAEEAARATGATVDQIVKSLVFSCDGRAVVVMVPGDRRADTGKIASVLGCERVRPAPANTVERLTGFPVGGVAPFPLPRIETVLIERALLEQELVWIGAGSTSHLAALAPADLARLARARAVDLVRDEPAAGRPRAS